MGCKFFHKNTARMYILEMLTIVLLWNSFYNQNIICLLVSILYIFFRDKIVLDSLSRKYFLLSGMFSIWMLCYKIIGISVANIGAIVRPINWMLVCYVGIQATQESNESNKIRIKNLVVAVIIIYVTYVLICYRNDSEVIIETLDTQYSGAIMLLAAAYFSNALEERKISSFAIFLLLSYIVIFISQRTINFVFLIGMCILIWYFYKPRHPVTNLIVILLVAGISLGLISGALSEAIKYLANYIPSMRIQERVIAVADYLVYGSEASGYMGVSLYGRQRLYMESINTVFSSVHNFLWGIGDDRLNGFSANLNGAGNHSLLFDTFARYGVFCSIVLIELFITMGTKIRERVTVSCNSFEKRSMMIMFFFYIAKNIIGDSSKPVVSYVMFFVIPIVLSDNSKSCFRYEKCTLGKSSLKTF